VPPPSLPLDKRTCSAATPWRRKPRRNCTPDSGLGNRRDPDFTSGFRVIPSRRGDRNCTGISGLEDQGSAVELRPGVTCLPERAELRTQNKEPRTAPGANAPGALPNARLSHSYANRSRVSRWRRPARKNKNPASLRARGCAEPYSISITSRHPAPSPCQTGMNFRISVQAFRIGKAGPAGKGGL
jgi:hypothetical protein